MQEAPVKVLLVGVDIGEEADFEYSMEELASLAEAAEKEVVGQIVQRLDHVNKALYIGTGKVDDVRRLAEERGAQEVVFDNSLTPSQVRNLGKELELTVIDRTNLILDIFAYVHRPEKPNCRWRQRDCNTCFRDWWACTMH